MRTLSRKPRRRSPGAPNALNLGSGIFLAALAAVALYANLPHVAAGGSAARAGTFTGQVTRVVDGDNFRISSKDIRIRVWGLDAPEVDQPGGSAATATLSRLISGQTLTCRQRDIAAVMIESGAAQEFCRYSGNHYRTC